MYFLKKVNISESYLAQLELGNKSIGMNTLLAICDYTGCSALIIFYLAKMDTMSISKKIIRIVNHLPDASLNLSYEVLSFY